MRAQTVRFVPITDGSHGENVVMFLRRTVSRQFELSKGWFCSDESHGVHTACIDRRSADRLFRRDAVLFNGSIAGISGKHFGLSQNIISPRTPNAHLSVT